MNRFPLLFIAFFFLLFIAFFLIFVSVSKAEVIDLSRYGEIVVTSKDEDEIIDELISVSWDTEREKWIGKAYSMKNEDEILRIEFPWWNRMFCDEGELIPTRGKGVKLFQLYSDKKDVPLGYYYGIRDKAHKVSVNSFKGK